MVRMDRILEEANSNGIIAERTLSGRSILSIKDLSKEQISSILAESEAMLADLERGRPLDYLKNRIMATLFFEPSTRTRLSFESAMQKLGGGVIGFADPGSSSAVKGESLADTVKVVSSYADIIVLRHPKEGSARKAAEHAEVPIINAGDGAGEHPTQALIDLFTIKMEKSRIKGLTVAIVGDLKYGRAIHSLAYALALFGSNLTLIAPDELQAPDSFVNELREGYGIGIEKASTIEKALDADVVYIPRVQKERFSDPGQYKKFADYYKVNREFLSRANGDIIIMSPLPRVTEISPEIDNMKNSVYFRQAAYGIPVRMAILKMILGR